MKKLIAACTIASLVLPFVAAADTTTPQLKTTMMNQSSVEAATSSGMNIEQALVLAIIAAAVLALMSKGNTVLIDG